MPASTSILDEKAFYGETLGTHSGHKLNLVISDYYDSHAVVFVHEYGIECDMYKGCGALILDNITFDPPSTNGERVIERWRKRRVPTTVYGKRTLAY